MPGNKPTLIVTGGAGFIGSAVCRHLIRSQLATVVNIDKLTYAASLASLAEIEDSPEYHFRKVDICDHASLRHVFAEFHPDGVIHLAAQSHVDRSIHEAAEFIETNLLGTFHLLEASRGYWSSLAPDRKPDFRFLHVSTDEVYGSLGDEGLFEETTPYNPSSPYSASKAGSDHLVTAWHRTYGLPVVISNCSNNYGPFQFPEKLIPLMIRNCMRHLPLPVYGEGANVRDWLFVDDHVKALWMLWKNGRVGEKYNVGGRNERRNIDVVRKICRLMDQYSPKPVQGGHETLITFVEDRPGHDARYAINSTKLETELGWTAHENFESGIEKTVRWYLENPSWWQPMSDGPDSTS
jgi:dTDP-glucose 4,6-dehydratase